MVYFYNKKNIVVFIFLVVNKKDLKFKFIVLISVVENNVVIIKCFMELNELNVIIVYKFWLFGLDKYFNFSLSFNIIWIWIGCFF